MKVPTRYSQSNGVLSLFFCFALFSLLLWSGCGGGGSSGGTNDPGNTGPDRVSTGDFVVLAWNDLGMHCLNSDYDTLVILPPYNTVWAQVIESGSPPRIVTSGITVSYRMVDNTYSDGKRDFGQFWTFDSILFGVDLLPDTGLNLVDPDLHNGLSGEMQVSGDHFQVDGIPVTPVDDALVYAPYQKVEITVKDSGGNILATTQATVPTSDEMNCAKCHGAEPNMDILREHDTENGTDLLNSRPVLCAGCHGTPALGAPIGAAGSYLSEAIHDAHADHGAECYDCHPGETTQCSRSLAHTSADGNCIACHGTLRQVADSIDRGGRIPWLDEPGCTDCHTNVAGVETGRVLYRNALGHGGIYCAGCHQSPHAMVPSRETLDNHQAVQYTGAAVTIGSCAACHDTSKGPEEKSVSDFYDKHGGAAPDERSACSLCHKPLPESGASTDWPHGFQWQTR